MRIRSILLAAVLATTAATTAYANKSNLDANAIRAQQAEIRQSAEAREGRYKDMEAPTRQRLFDHQDRVASLLGDVSVTTELSEPKQVELFNNLEAISAIVNKAEDERLVCSRHKPVGSKRPVTTCKTVAQLRADKEQSDRMQSNRNLGCADHNGPAGCGGVR